MREFGTLRVALVAVMLAAVMQPLTLSAALQDVRLTAAETPSVSAESMPPEGASSGVIAKAKGKDKRPKHLPTPKGKSDKAHARDLMKTGAYEYVEPNYVRVPLGFTSTPNDPHFTDTTAWSFGGPSIPSAKSWWVQGMASARFSNVWPSLEETDSPYFAQAPPQAVPVAVIDTGFYLDHPDRAANIVPKKDYFESYSDATGYVTDDDVTPAPLSAPGNDEPTAAHGTMCASEIAQSTDNGVGGAAASPGAEVWVYKVHGIWVEGDSSWGYPPGSAVMFDDAVLNAVYDAADSGARVISMSLGGTDFSQAYQDAVSYARDKGVVVVAATGNHGMEGIYYPARLNDVVAVGSTAATMVVGAPSILRSHFSNWGEGIDLMAPGSAIWGPIRPGYDEGYGVPGYTFWNGTSMATPLVAAAAVNILRFMPDLTPAEVEALLTSTARDMADTTKGESVGYDLKTGWGQIDMTAAYNKLKTDYPALTAPVLSGVDQSWPLTDAPTISWPAVPDAAAYLVSIDGSHVATTTDTTFRPVSLAEGEREVTVRSYSPRNWNGAYSTTSATFVMGNAVLARPVLSAPGGVITTLPVGVSWDAVEYATGYEVSVNGGVPTFVSSTSHTLSTLVAGANIVVVAAVDGTVRSESTTATIAYSPMSLGPVSVTGPVTVFSPSVVVSWAAVANATGYEVRLGTGDPVAVAGLSANVALPAPGAHTVSVRATGPGGFKSAWGGHTVTYEAPRETLLTLKPSRTSVAWGSSVTLSGFLRTAAGAPVSGRSITIQRSTDRKSWKSVALPTTAVDGSWSTKIKPGRTYYWRAVFMGDASGEHLASWTSPVRVKQLVSISAASAGKSTLARGRTYTWRASLKPRHKAGTYPVRMKAYRWERGTWVLRKTVKLKAYDYSSYTRVTVKTALPYRGTWKLVTVYDTTSKYAQTTASRKLSVR